MAEFLVARNPDAASTLPYLVRLPLGPNGIVLKVRDTWPRTAKVYCHPSTDWPAEPELVERVPVRSCVRRGAAIDLVLDRGRENRSQFVFARARGREVIFWQSARTARQARPNVAVPHQRAAGQVLEILVDSRERYPWTFSAQQATTRRQALTAGDYAVAADGVVVAAVERKSLPDLVSTLTGGKLRSLLAALADVPRSALVVEDRYSQLFKLAHVRPAVVLDGLAEAQVHFPDVPIVFTETRPLAQEWCYRFLGAALVHIGAERAAEARTAALPGAEPGDLSGGRADPSASARARVGTGQPRRGPAADGGGDEAPVSPAEVRLWALANGHDVAARGRIAAAVVAAYQARDPGVSEPIPDAAEPTDVVSAGGAEEPAFGGDPSAGRPDEDDRPQHGGEQREDEHPG